VQVATLKHKFAQCSGYSATWHPVGPSKCIYQGKILRPEQTLSEAGVLNGGGSHPWYVVMMEMGETLRDHSKLLLALVFLSAPEIHWLIFLEALPGTLAVLREIDNEQKDRETELIQLADALGALIRLNPSICRIVAVGYLLEPSPWRIPVAWRPLQHH